MRYFTMDELCRSDYATANKIVNTPTAEAVYNLTMLVDKLLDSVRKVYGKPIVVTSGYRCKALNKAVGGAATSQHVKGEAVDIVGASYKDNVEIAKIITTMDYDQLILEQYDSKKKQCKWVHVSYCEGKNRKEIMRYAGGKYTKISTI